jgi:hypothetical protein
MRFPLCPLILGAAISLGALLPVASARAEVEKMLTPCGGEKLCPFFKPSLVVPEGWVEDRAAGRPRGLLVLVPKGSTFDTADAVIYARAQWNPDRASLDAFVERDHAQWRARHEGARIEPLGEIAQAGGAAFREFRFSAPGLRQPYERIGATVDRDRDGNAYFVSVVLTGVDRGAVDAAQAAYLGILKGY